MNKRKPASKLRLARVAKGWPIGALAEEAGLAISTIRRLETGVTEEANQTTRRALSRVLGVSASKLF